MTYSNTTPVLGLGKASPAAIDAWFANRGPGYAPEYAPDGKYKAAPPLGASIVAWATKWGINADLAAGQILDETAAWQSKYARERNNPGGIGAINSNPDQAIFFPSVDAGVRAHMAHLCTYVRGLGEWTQFDVRSQAIVDEGWQGTVTVLKDLGGKWAFPGTTYGQSIADLANNLVNFANDGAWNVPSDAPQAPVSHAKPAMVAVTGITNMDGYSGVRRIDAVVCHVTDDENAQGTLAWFQNPASKASANCVIDFDGTIYECVPKNHSAWTNGHVDTPDVNNPLILAWLKERVSFSQRTYTIERVGDRNTQPTEAQFASMSAVIAWVAAEENIPIDRTHVLGHNQIDSVGRAYCPSLTDNDWSRILDGARGAAAMPTDDALTFLDVGIPWKVVLGFFGLYSRLRQLGLDLPLLGYPQSDEFSWTVPGTTKSVHRAAQKFERGWLVYLAENSPPFDIVMAPLDAHAELEAQLANAQGVTDD